MTENNYVTQSRSAGACGCCRPMKTPILPPGIAIAVLSVIPESAQARPGRGNIAWTIALKLQRILQPRFPLAYAALIIEKLGFRVHPDIMLFHGMWHRRDHHRYGSGLSCSRYLTRRRLTRTIRNASEQRGMVLAPIVNVW